LPDTRTSFSWIEGLDTELESSIKRPISLASSMGMQADDGSVRPSQLAKVMLDLDDPTPWPNQQAA